MKTAIVVRSYINDFCWLEWLVKSLDKFLTGETERVLITPIGQVPSASVLKAFNRHIQTRETCASGYISQQVDKLESWRYTDCDLIMFWDSDCPLKRPFDVRERIIGGKPLLYRTIYTLIPQYAQKWQAVVKRDLGFAPDFEYMRSQPMFHSVEMLRQLEGTYPHLRKRAESLVEGDLFSEFNLMGAFADRFCPELYHFSEDPHPYICEQFWSWGGITDDVRARLDELFT